MSSLSFESVLDFEFNKLVESRRVLFYLRLFYLSYWLSSKIFFLRYFDYCWLLIEKKKKSNITRAMNREMSVITHVVGTVKKLFIESTVFQKS